MDGDRLRWFVLGMSLFCCVLLENVTAQSNSPKRHWIYLKDKGSQNLELLGADPQSLGISPRALRRRAKVLPPDRLIDERDLPVAQEYLDQLRARGLKIRFTSRWLNSVSVEITPTQLAELSSLPFVKSINVVTTAKRPEPPVSERTPATSLFKEQRREGLDYGPSLTQLQNMKVPEVHSLGINGSGVLVGMIDDGFNNHTIHRALKNIRVISEYDFIQSDSNTSRSPEETYVGPGGLRQGDHGAGVLSSVAGFDNGYLIGGAYGVEVVLAKTEIDSIEIHAEEDNYVEALEWMERLGVDVASASLGYKEFDNTTYSYTYQDLNGHTTIVAKAATVAAQKGVLLCNAMGNEGFQFKNGNNEIVNALQTITSPADADSILAVGATLSDRMITSFSSTGPTSDNRVKPDVVAQGTLIRWAYGSSTTGYFTAQGTSCSTPLVASCAALLLSAHPELTPMQLRDAILKTATHVSDGTSQTQSYPNNVYGYGFIDALEATLYHGLVFSNRPIVVSSDSFFTITTWIKSKSTLTADSLFVYYKKPADVSFQRALLTPSGQPDQYFVRIVRSVIDSTSVGYFYARDNSGTSRRSPYNAPDSIFSLAPTPDSIVGVFPPPVGNDVPEEFVLHANYPNPFNGSTTILFDAPRSEEIELAVYNVLGQRIRTLLSGRSIQGSRVNRATWNGMDEYNQQVPSGVYFYRLKTQNSVISNKMLYLK